MVINQKLLNHLIQEYEDNIKRFKQGEGAFGNAYWVGRCFAYNDVLNMIKDYLEEEYEEEVEKVKQIRKVLNEGEDVLE